jgi:fatty acid desaturase
VIIAVFLLLAGVAIRQVDRWHYSLYRENRKSLSSLSLHEIIRLQRQNSNNVTPALLLAGHWLEIVGWWALGGWLGGWYWLIVASAVAVKFRHLQEVSHFGIHRVLCRSPRVGDNLIEFGAHAPLALVAVSVRRDKHVRRHHPNATRQGIDPNLVDLGSAGMCEGCRLLGFVRAVAYPLTLTGIVATCRGLGRNLISGGSPWWRIPVFSGVLVLSYLVAGWPALVFGVAVPRILLYPQLSWLSLLVEHRWFDAEVPSGRPVEVEAGRCLRLYYDRQIFTALVRVSWLPYSDLFHFAHSAHPSVRWNYLPAVERIVGLPEFTPEKLIFGHSSAISCLYRATRSAREVPSAHRPTMDCVSPNP